MSIIDKVVAAVTPPESDAARAEARRTATAATSGGDWLAMVLQHHVMLEEAFMAVKQATDAGGRTAALKHLGIVLMGHAIAEEAVLYPALQDAGEGGHAKMGYTEQVAVKMQMAALEKLPPMSQDFLDKLEHVRGAVAHHMFEEEGTWFPELKRKVSATNQAMLTSRYAEEFDRYVGRDAH